MTCSQEYHNVLAQCLDSWFSRDSCLMSERSFKETQYIKIKRAQSKVAVVEWEKL